eukprot:301944-Prymnesium_polylepis.1
MNKLASKRSPYVEGSEANAMLARTRNTNCSSAEHAQPGDGRGSMARQASDAENGASPENSFNGQDETLEPAKASPKSPTKGKGSKKSKEGDDDGDDGGGGDSKKGKKCSKASRTAANRINKRGCDLAYRTSTFSHRTPSAAVTNPPLQ